MFDGRNNLNDTLEDQKRTTAGIYGYRGIGLWCSTPLKKFQLYRGDKFYWWTKTAYPEKTTIQIT
jgi:hypothetical protein